MPAENASRVLLARRVLAACSRVEAHLVYNPHLLAARTGLVLVAPLQRLLVLALWRCLWLQASAVALARRIRQCLLEHLIAVYLVLLLAPVACQHPAAHEMLSSVVVRQGESSGPAVDRWGLAMFPQNWSGMRVDLAQALAAGGLSPAGQTYVVQAPQRICVVGTDHRVRPGSPVAD
jgi:hypothetical protein